MNCHNNENKSANCQDKGHKGHSKHMLWMVLCCAIPIVLLLLLPLLKIDNPFLSSVLPYAVFILCPLLHLFMMPLMMGKGKNKNTQVALQAERQKEEI